MSSLPPEPRGREDGRLRIGFTYNQKRIDPKKGGDDTEAEFDPPATIDAIAAALEKLGHEIVRLEATPDLMSRLATRPVDLVFNMAEAFHGRNREAQVPAMLEFLDLPFTGSDTGTMAVALDKHLAKHVVAAAGVPTPASVVMYDGHEPLPADLRFPVIAKPNAEGSSKGIHAKSVVEDEPALRVLLAEMAPKFREGVLVEGYVTGREFTVGLLGDPHAPRVLPVMEVVFAPSAGPRPVYSFAHKLDYCDEVRYDCPPRDLAPEHLARLEKAARDAYRALRCRDVARIDFRMDAEGTPWFIEANPLPGLTPKWSDLCMIADAAGLNYDDLIAAITRPAIERCLARRRGA